MNATRTRQLVLLRVDVHAELVLRVRHALHAIHVHLRLRAAPRVVEQLAHLLLSALRRRQLPSFVPVVVRALPLRHLLANLALHRGRVRGRLVREHAHQVRNLHLRLGRLEQPLLDHLLLLLLARHAPLRPELLLLALRQLQRLRRRRRRLRRRLHRHRVLDVQRDLLRLDVPLPSRDVVVAAGREYRGVPPLDVRDRVQRQRRLRGGSRGGFPGAAALDPRARAERDQVRVRVLLELLELRGGAALAGFARGDLPRFGLAELGLQTHHVRLSLEPSFFHELRREEKSREVGWVFFTRRGQGSFRVRRGDRGWRPTELTDRGAFGERFRVGVRRRRWQNEVVFTEVSCKLPIPNFIRRRKTTQKRAHDERENRIARRCRPDGKGLRSRVTRRQLSGRGSFSQA
eukprot:30965-Pelagococcus_subviridis.AAC.3